MEKEKLSRHLKFWKGFRRRISDEWFAGYIVFELFPMMEKITVRQFDKIQIDFHWTLKKPLCDLPAKHAKYIRDIETFSVRSFEGKLFDVALREKESENYNFSERIKINIFNWTLIEVGKTRAVFAIRKITVNWAWKINYLSLRREICLSWKIMLIRVSWKFWRSCLMCFLNE